ncbi:MAG: condensation domain-containing protein [Sphingobacterium sp.]
MNRRLLFGERMLLGEDKEPFHAVIPFRLRGSFTGQAIRRALEQLQDKHPLLQALIAHDKENAPWFNVSELTVPIPIRVLEREGEDHWQEESKREWNTPFNYQQQPLIRFVWIKGDDVSDMLFVFHHCLCDGGSAMVLLDEFLRLLDDSSYDIGVEHPILGIQDIVPAAILEDRMTRLKARAIGRLVTLAIKCIPLAKNPVNRADDYLIHWKLDQIVSSRLLAYSKSAGVTVNTFLSAKVLLAFKKVRASAAFNKVSCPVDIRRFAPQIKQDQLFAFGLMIVLSYKNKYSFLKNLRTMQETVGRKTKKLNPYLTMMVMESAHEALPCFSRLLKRGKSSNDCMFSNLGRIDIAKGYKRFELDTVFSPSVIGPLGNTTTIVTSTFGGEIDFSFIGSEGYLPYAEAIAIRDELNESIKREIDNRAVQ